MSCEIVELIEDDGYEGNKLSDIHKLFETLDMAGISSFSLHKSAMRSASPLVVSIGISSSLSLKQALRGLCISQASEMAAVKKRSSKPSVSESGSGSIPNMCRALSFDPCVPRRGVMNVSQHGHDPLSGRTGQVSLFSEMNPLQSVETPQGDRELPRLFSKNGKTLQLLTSMERGYGSESSKNSTVGECSSRTSHSEESRPSLGTSRGCSRYDTSRDLRWKAITCIVKQQGQLDLRNFKLLKKIGNGNTGTVYLCQLISTSNFFAMKVIDNGCLESSRQLLRAQTEIEVLKDLCHPFLPTLYAHFTTSKFTCLLMDYCSGGDLHVLRQKQLKKHLSEKAARFYVAEVVAALEYLHILGVVHRDLKPENILIGEDGHIVLSDFNLSIKITVTPSQLKPSNPNYMEKRRNSSSGCMNNFFLQQSSQLSCLSPCFTSDSASITKEAKLEAAHRIIPMAPANSFVGTHEYLAPEIIKGEGYGFSVDWWALGILLYELLYGESPFRGATNEETINNVISQSIKFPKSPAVRSQARDLITKLLSKDPGCRLGSEKDALEIKKHPFFQAINWALIREQMPPIPFC